MACHNDKEVSRSLPCGLQNLMGSKINNNYQTHTLKCNKNNWWQGDFYEVQPPRFYEQNIVVPDSKRGTTPRFNERNLVLLTSQKQKGTFFNIKLAKKLLCSRNQTGFLKIKDYECVHIYNWFHICKDIAILKFFFR